MKRIALAAAGVFVVSLLASSFADPALAQGRGRGQDKNKAAGTKADKADADHEPRFGQHDRDVVARYYGQHSGLPPGLAKRNGDLPPGLEKQLERNGTLPPGLQKRLRPLPSALEHQLPRLPHGFRRGIIDQHLIVYRDGTYRIADSIFHAVR